jgi:hypothetical protein
MTVTAPSINSGAVNLDQGQQSTNWQSTGGFGSVGSTNVSPSGALGAIESSLVESNNASANRTLYGRACEDVPVENIYIGRRAMAASGEVQATLFTGADLGISGTQATLEYDAKAGAKLVSLKKGNVVVAPKEDIVIDTAFGQVNVAAHSVVMIMALPSGTAVFNLDDTHKNAVVITSGTARLPIAPGCHAMVTSQLVERFEMVNPAELIAHRNVRSHKLENGLQAFSSDFLTTHAMSNVKQLRLLMASQHPEAQKLSAHMLKTAAILSDISVGNGQYQAYLHPRVTATALTH